MIEKERRRAAIDSAAGCLLLLAGGAVSLLVMFFRFWIKRHEEKRCSTRETQVKKSTGEAAELQSCAERKEESEKNEERALSLRLQKAGRQTVFFLLRQQRQEFHFFPLLFSTHTMPLQAAFRSCSRLPIDVLAPSAQPFRHQRAAAAERRRQVRVFGARTHLDNAVLESSGETALSTPSST